MTASDGRHNFYTDEQAQTQHDPAHGAISPAAGGRIDEQAAGCKLRFAPGARGLDGSIGPDLRETPGEFAATQDGAPNRRGGDRVPHGHPREPAVGPTNEVSLLQELEHFQPEALLGPAAKQSERRRVGRERPR